METILKFELSVSDDQEGSTVGLFFSNIFINYFVADYQIYFIYFMDEIWQFGRFSTVRKRSLSWEILAVMYHVMNLIINNCKMISEKSEMNK